MKRLQKSPELKYANKWALNNMITVTESARFKIADIIAEENKPGVKVRAFVQGGGCSGFQYGFTLEEEQSEDDFEFNGVLVDSMSIQYLNGATIDYKEDTQGSQFVIQNPNSTTTCGCGSSFSV
jgi:iron-sulfur cluster insertion protein